MNDVLYQALLAQLYLVCYLSFGGGVVCALMWRLKT
jgi:hypothetical protein